MFLMQVGFVVGIYEITQCGNHSFERNYPIRESQGWESKQHNALLAKYNRISWKDNNKAEKKIRMAGDLVCNDIKMGNNRLVTLEGKTIDETKQGLFPDLLPGCSSN